MSAFLSHAGSAIAALAHTPPASHAAGVLAEQFVGQHAGYLTDEQRERSIRFCGEQMQAWADVDNAVARFWMEREYALIRQRDASPTWVRATEEARGLA